MRAGLIVIALTICGQPAWAQRVTETETGSNIGAPRRARISDQPGISKFVRGRVVMAEFARCAIDRSRRKAEQAVSLLPGNDFSKAIVGLATQECLDKGEIRFQPITMRGPLFKELYIRRMASHGTDRAWSTEITKIALTVSSVDMSEDQRQHLALMAFGACVIAKSPDKARDIVLQPTASASQDSAIAAIVPSLSGCLTQGATLRMGKQVIEGAIAEVLYRGIAVSPVPASAAEFR